MTTTPNIGFWSNKKVLVTGHTGFKGGWLSLWLHKLGANVCGYSLPAPTSPSLFETCQIANGITSITADIRDERRLLEVTQQFKPKIVLHLAAQSLVLQSYQEPRETYTTNVIGTLNVLEAVREVDSVKSVVVVTSDKCYENQEREAAYVETDPMGGYDPYSSSKGCTELLVSAYRQSYFNPNDFANHGVGLAAARAGNVIGGGDWAENRLLPDLARAFSAGEPVDIRYPNAVRPWQHVLEPLRGYLLLAQKLFEDGPAYSEAWNFGPDENDTKTVGYVAEKFQQEWGGGEVKLANQKPSLHEAGLLKLDSSKSKTRLGCYPVWSIDKTIAQIASWHQAHVDANNNEHMREFSLKQLAEFEHDCAEAANANP